jgi:hypothetical protein
MPIFPSITKISIKIIKIHFYFRQQGRPGNEIRPTLHTRARSARSALPPARDADRWTPAVSDRRQGSRHPASSGELALAGEELARPTEHGLVLSVTRRTD